ncbi:nucleic-acid-binding protein from mobile element jockey [Elysia marginata]|uniref:Nucleic-acid-binding protein from mobile element jockey n=1 Tax=Elysia marginata TaxID=1093978 RepID=A0AAV4H0F7_9GAST|nr:nucleic-acid-binding protein from mobile element jockey [Elysia marginata]
MIARRKFEVWIIFFQKRKQTGGQYDPCCPIGWSLVGLGLPLRGSPGAAAVGLITCVPLLGSVENRNQEGDRRIKTNTFVLTFNTPTPPQEIKAGYLPLTVRPYVPTPMRCFRCHRYGHGRNKCRAKEELCVRCGEPGHGSEECKRDVRCVNCKGDHPANSKTCTKYMEEQAILRYRASNGGTFKQALAAVVVNVAKEIRPKLFTQVVRGTSTRAVTTSATVKESVGVPSQVSTTARDGPVVLEVVPVATEVVAEGIVLVEVVVVVVVVVAVAVVVVVVVVVAVVKVVVVVVVVAVVGVVVVVA